jgi:hypothetical protein
MLLCQNSCKSRQVLLRHVFRWLITSSVWRIEFLYKRLIGRLTDQCRSYLQCSQLTDGRPAYKDPQRPLNYIKDILCNCYPLKTESAFLCCFCVSNYLFAYLKLQNGSIWFKIKLTIACGLSCSCRWGGTMSLNWGHQRASQAIHWYGGPQWNDNRQGNSWFVHQRSLAIL